jgi:hypothetical protein
MPRQSPYQIVLSDEETEELQRRSVKYTLPYFQVVRAKMILLAAEGRPNDEIAHRLASRREVVSMWRKRFVEQRLAGLDDQARPGRPRLFPPRGRGARQSVGLRTAGERRRATGALDVQRSGHARPPKRDRRHDQ